MPERLQALRTMKETNVLIRLPYGNDKVSYMPEHPAITAVRDEYRENRALYKTLKSLKGNLRKAQRGESGSQFDGRRHALARPLYIMSVASIQTPTDQWEQGTRRWIDGDISLKDYMWKCQDSQKKLNAIERVEETDILDRVNSALRGHHVRKAVDLLSGKGHDINTYLKGVKAWMPVTMMFHVGVIDTNVHATIKPILRWNLNNCPIFHPDMDSNARGKAMAHSEKWTKGKIPPVEKDFLDRRISRKNKQHDIEQFWNIIQTVMSDSSDIPKDVLPQVLFNVGGAKQESGEWDRTIHAPIYEAIGSNLEKFEE